VKPIIEGIDIDGRYSPSLAAEMYKYHKSARRPRIVWRFAHCDWLLDIQHPTAGRVASHQAATCQIDASES
jgi:hypothetical protein